MASALDEDDLGNDDYYSLLNVRREVRVPSGPYGSSRVPAGHSRTLLEFVGQIFCWLVSS